MKFHDGISLIIGSIDSNDPRFHQRRAARGRSTESSYASICIRNAKNETATVINERCRSHVITDVVTGKLGSSNFRTICRPR